MPWCFAVLIAGLSTPVVQAYAPLWMTRGGKKGLAVLPQGFSRNVRGSVEPQRLTITTEFQTLIPSRIPYFSAKADQTITWDMGWCLEADGNAARVNRCTGDLAQKWNLIPDGKGRNMLQLKDTKMCLDVERGTQDILNGAPIGLHECASQVTDSWQFEEPLAPLENFMPSLSRWHAMMSFMALAVLGLFSLSVGLWRKQNARASGVRLHAEQGGVSMAVPAVMMTTKKNSDDMFCEQFSKAASRQELKSNKRKLQYVRTQLIEPCKKKEIDRVLEILHECELSELWLPPSIFAQALSAFGSTSCKSEVEKSKNFGYAKQIFERARSTCKRWDRHTESIYSLMVRIASRAGELDTAMQYLREMAHPPMSTKPHLRTFIPIFEACASAGQTDEAERLYNEDFLPALETESVRTDEEEGLWQIVFALRLRAWSAAVKMGKALDPDGLTTILQDIASVCPQLSDLAIVDALQEAFEVQNWCTKTGVCISADGLCPVTLKTLQAFKPCDSDLRKLLDLTERLAIENASQQAVDYWTRFKTWLETATNDWDTVIDGANVGFTNQNFVAGAFSHLQIDELVAQCVKEGRRKPAVVLRKHWLSPRTNFAVPSKRKMVQRPQLDLSQENMGESEFSAPPVTEQENMGESEFSAPPVTEETPARSGEVDVPLATDRLSEAQRRVDETGQRSQLDLLQEDVDEPVLCKRQRSVVDIVKSWKSRGILVVSPPRFNDDWVALYIALVMCLRGVPDVQFVSNDNLRDHFWRMRYPQAFQDWRDRHMTRYAIFSRRLEAVRSNSERKGKGKGKGKGDDISVQLFRPPVYTYRAQRSLDGKCWHFPVRLEMGAQKVGRTEVKELSQQVEWLVAFVPNELQT